MLRDGSNLIVVPTDSLFRAMSVIDQTGLQTCLVADAGRRLLGTLSDGDLRRALLGGATLETAVQDVMIRTPLCATPDDEREDLLAILQRFRIRVLPVVDNDRRIVGVAVLDDLVSPCRRDNWVILLAGGLGTRLRPLTEHLPKPLIEVGGRPILETIVRHLAREGFHRFFLSINYLGTKVKEHFGDGSRWNVDIAYIEEPTPMGTAGALGLLPERPSLPFLVMNGDLLTDVSLGGLVDYHCSHEATATVAICKYDIQVPFGVTRLDGHYVVAIEEKPKQSFQINAGIYVFEPSVLDMIEPERALDAPQLVMRILAKGGQVAAFPLREMWLDIGRHEDLLRARSKFGDDEA